MQMNVEGLAPGAGEVGVGKLVGAVAAPVLEEVVVVAGLEAAEEPASRGEGAEGAGGRVEGDLEVDEVGAAVVAEEDVFALLEVDVGHVAGVEGVEEGSEAGEEVVGDGLVALEGAAGDEGVEEAGVGDAAEVGGDAVEVGEAEVVVGFAASEEAADPAEGEEGDGARAAELRHGERGRSRKARRHGGTKARRGGSQCRAALGMSRAIGGGFLIEAGGGEEVVLEGVGEAPGAGVDGEGAREAFGAEGEKPGRRATGRGIRRRGFHLRAY